MNIGANFNKFDFRRAFFNAIQVFIIGWIAITGLLFTWSASSDFGFEKTVEDFSVEMIFSPLFWLIPALVAIVVGVLRGVRREDIDVTNPDELDRYFDGQKFSNQPRWFKLSVWSFCLLFLATLFYPDTEVSKERYQFIDDMMAKEHTTETSLLYADIRSDGKIMESEFVELRNAFISDIKLHKRQLK
jgi:hypothetical protein